MVSQRRHPSTRAVQIGVSSDVSPLLFLVVIRPHEEHYIQSGTCTLSRKWIEQFGRKYRTNEKPTKAEPQKKDDGKGIVQLRKEKTEGRT